MVQAIRHSPSSKDAGTNPIATRQHPAWYDELTSNLAIRSQFVLTGNLRDRYISPDETLEGFLRFDQVLWRLVHSKRIVALLIHDPIDGLRLHDECDARLAKAFADHGIELGQVARTPAALAALQKQITDLRTIAVAFVIDYSSHLMRENEDGLGDLFLQVHQSAHKPLPQRPQQANPPPLRNPTIWITDQPADLPGWFIVDNDTLREIHLERPTLEDRFGFARTLLPRFPEKTVLGAEETKRLLEQFAMRCEGETLVAMEAIAELAVSEDMGLAQIPDAIAIYRTGARRNPWKSPVLRSRMSKARDILTKRVRGQNHAVDKTVDILMRSITGLSGAQTGHRHTRPRGVLMFAGPTGVGKTELAKSVTELLFGDETACHRFDMSEFMEQDSVTRLIGAPPGHPGHERGGELINALHKRPFSVFLFDEIEKAHPRILDTFLQILDEGRLTDARGVTAFFSEALIIFTSNIGMFGDSRAQNMGLNVMPSDPHAVVVTKITKAVQDYFRFDLKRPELMNRIGQNVVVFDFIGRESQRMIFNAITQRVLDTILDEQQIVVRFSDQAYAQLEELCTQHVFDGGRGIGNRVETYLINPLAHEIFNSEPRSTLTIQSIDTEGTKTIFRCACDPDSAPAAAQRSRRL